MALPRTTPCCSLILKSIHLDIIIALISVPVNMSRNGAPIASDHEEQMAFARQFQAERGPVKPRKHNRHRGESAKKAPESLNGNHKPTSYGNQVTSHLGRSTSITTSVNRGTSSAMRTGVRGGGLSSSIWADSTTQDYVPPHLRDRGRSHSRFKHEFH